jgi:hypothetical protein
MAAHGGNAERKRSGSEPSGSRHLRRDEHQQMQDYVSLPFGEPHGFSDRRAGRRSSVLLRNLHYLHCRPTVDTQLVLEAAVAFLRRTSLPIEPRKKWPDGGMPRYGVKGSLAPAHQAQPGKACAFGATPVGAAWSGKASTTTPLFRRPGCCLREDDSRMESPTQADLGDLRSFAASSRSRPEFRETLGCGAGSAVSYGHRENRRTDPNRKRWQTVHNRHATSMARSRSTASRSRMGRSSWLMTWSIRAGR